jgi:hypothetical protein
LPGPKISNSEAFETVEANKLMKKFFCSVFKNSFLTADFSLVLKASLLKRSQLGI